MTDFCINSLGEIVTGGHDCVLINESELDNDQLKILRKWQELDSYAGNHSSVRAYAGVLNGKPYRTLCVEFACEVPDFDACQRVVTTFAGRFGGSIDVMGDGQSGDAYDYAHWAVDIECLDLDGSELTTLFCQVWLYLQQSVSLHRFIHQVC